MDALAKGFTICLLAIGGISVYVVIGTLTGGIAGWIVGLIFSDTILGILAQIGIKGITMFQFGCFMGFVGGFLKTKVTAKVEKK